MNQASTAKPHRIVMATGIALIVVLGAIGYAIAMADPVSPAGGLLMLAGVAIGGLVFLGGLIAWFVDSVSRP